MQKWSLFISVFSALVFFGLSTNTAKASFWYQGNYGTQGSQETTGYYNTGIDLRSYIQGGGQGQAIGGLSVMSTHAITSATIWINECQTGHTAGSSECNDPLALITSKNYYANTIEQIDATHFKSWFQLEPINNATTTANIWKEIYLYPTTWADGQWTAAHRFYGCNTDCSIYQEAKSTSYSFPTFNLTEYFLILDTAGTIPDANKMTFKNPKWNERITQQEIPIYGFCPFAGTDRLFIYGSTIGENYGFLNGTTTDFSIDCSDINTFTATITATTSAEWYLTGADISILDNFDNNAWDEVRLNPEETANEFAWCADIYDENVIYGALRKFACWLIVGDPTTGWSNLASTTQNTLENKIPFAYFAKFKETYDDQATSTNHNLIFHFSTTTLPTMWSSATPTDTFLSVNLFDFDNPNWFGMLPVLEWIEDYILPPLITLWLLWFAIKMFKKL